MSVIKRPEPGENIRIKYVTSWDGVERSYTPDFLVGNVLVEVKPVRLRSSKVVQLKQQAAEEYCGQHGLVYKMVHPIPLPDDKVKSLRDAGIVKFIDRYERLFLEKYDA